MKMYILILKVSSRACESACLRSFQALGRKFILDPHDYIKDDFQKSRAIQV